VQETRFIFAGARVPHVRYRSIARSERVWLLRHLAARLP